MNFEIRSAFLAIAFVALGAGCTNLHLRSHLGDPCELEDGGSSACPEGTYCALASSDGKRTCRVLCDGGTPGSRRCTPGEVCAITYEPAPAPNPATCWPGGDHNEGEACRGTNDCARGLLCVENRGTAPSSDGSYPSTCEPVCNSSADCGRAGDRCVRESYCDVPCEPSSPSSCPTGSACRIDYCEWDVRAADCENLDGPDCPLGDFCAGRRDDGTPMCQTPVEFLTANCPPGICVGVCGSRPCSS